MVAALLRPQPREPKLAHRLAVAGSIAVSFLTAILDAVVWPAFFPV